MRKKILTLNYVKPRPSRAFREYKFDIFSNIYEPLSPKLLRKVRIDRTLSTVRVKTRPHAEDFFTINCAKSPLLHSERPKP